MRAHFSRRLGVPAVVLVAAMVGGGAATAQTLTWGVNGAGGSGTWNASNSNWFNGSQNVPWASGGNAIFSGASGGTVSSFTPGPVVSSMTFNTPGYVIQNGWIQAGSSGLTVTTNVDATINSTLSSTVNNASFLVKNGPAALVVADPGFLDSIQINQGELRTSGNASQFFTDMALANTVGATLTFGQTSSSVDVGSLTGGGTSGGLVHPDGQARTVTLNVWGSGTFGGTLADNGSGILGLTVLFNNTAQTLTNANTYSGVTNADGKITFSGNGSALNSPVTISSAGSLVLDNSGTALANRISDTRPLTMNRADFQLQGNSTTPVEEVVGPLSISSASNITLTQPGAAATQLTAAGLQRDGAATLNINGAGVGIAGLANGPTGIVPPYVTAGNEWAIVGGDNHIAPFTGYASDLNAGASGDHVKLATSGTTTMAAAETRASLNLQNSNAAVGQILDLAGQNLQLTSGGLLSSGAGTTSIRNGTLSTTAHEMIITANNNLAINSPITDGGGTTSLTKSGTGVLTLSAPNTYSGVTSVVAGTLVVSSDANLGLASTLDLSGGTLRAAASFSSPKGITSISTTSAAVDTAGFDLTFSGANSGGLSKFGAGTLTLNGTAPTFANLVQGVLVLPHGSTGDVQVSGGTLRVSGTVSILGVSTGLDPNGPILDLGGTAAATLTTNLLQLGGFGNLRIDFGIGKAQSDLWVLSTPPFFPTSGTLLQFEFQNLGGVVTGVDYPLISFPNSLQPPSPSLFALAPDMAAAGWAGTFHVTPTGVSVRFSSVPEPRSMVLAALGLFVLGATARRARR